MIRRDLRSTRDRSVCEASNRPVPRSASREMCAKSLNAPSESNVRARWNETPAANHPDDTFNFDPFFLQSVCIGSHGFPLFLNCEALGSTMPPGSIGSSTTVPGDAALRASGAFAVGRADAFRDSAVEDPKTIPWRYDSDRFPTVIEFVPRHRRRDPCVSATCVAGSASWFDDTVRTVFRRRCGCFSARSRRCNNWLRRIGILCDQCSATTSMPVAGLAFLCACSQNRSCRCSSSLRITTGSSLSYEARN